MNIKQTFNRHCKTNETTCSQKGMQQELVAFLFLVIRIIIQMNHFYLQTSNVPNLQKKYSHSVTYSQNLIYSFIILPIKCAKIDQQRTYPVSYKLIKIEIYGKLSDDIKYTDCQDKYSTFTMLQISIFERGSVILNC